MPPEYPIRRDVRYRRSRPYKHNGTMQRRLYHGGPPRLYPGDYILPPCETGEPSTAIYGAGAVCRTDRVYVTTDPQAAAIYAAFHRSGKGQVYEVEPEGGLTPDLDCTAPGLSFETERARIVRMIRLTKRQRQQIRAIILAA